MDYNKISKLLNTIQPYSICDKKMDQLKLFIKWLIFYQQNYKV